MATAYDGSTAVAEGDVTTDRIDLVKIESNLELDADNVGTQLNNVDGFILSASATLTVSVDAIDALQHSTPEKLTNLHSDIAAEDKVLLVLRSVDTQTLAVGDDFTDTDENVVVSLDGVLITLSVYSQSEEIGSEDNTIFILLQDITPLLINTIPGIYRGASLTNTGATGSVVDLVKVTSSLPSPPASSHLVDVDGFDLRDATTAVSLPLTTTYSRGLVRCASRTESPASGYDSGWR